MAKDNLDLIGKMLRKAESTNSEHERDAFMSRAQTLASRYSIDLAVARAHVAKAEMREQPEEQTVTLGQKGKNNLAMYVTLFDGIARVNDVRCLVAHDSTRIYPHGMPSDIEVVKALYASIVVQMIEAGDEYIRSGQYKEEKVWVEGQWKKVGKPDAWGWREEDWVPGHYKPVDGRVARRAFYNGYISRIINRLRAAKEEAVEAAVSADTEMTEMIDDNGKALTSTALVLREKSKEVEAYFEERKQAQNIRGTWRGHRNTRTSGGHSARRAGSEAAQNARLSGAKALGAGRTGITR